MSYILVVDDDPDQRELVREILEGMHHSVVLAENGRDALATLSRQMPSAIILDLRMPVMSGFEVLEALTKIPRASAVPVLVMSAYGFEWEAELIGAAGFLAKPLDPAEVRARLDAILRPARAHVLH